MKYIISTQQKKAKFRTKQFIDPAPEFNQNEDNRGNVYIHTYINYQYTRYQIYYVFIFFISIHW